MIKHILKTLLFATMLFTNTQAAAQRTSIKNECEKISTIIHADVHITAIENITADSNTCTINYKGTGAEFESKHYPTLAEMKEGLDRELKIHGWVYTKRAKSYDADAPFSTQFAREKSDSLLIVSLEATSLVECRSPENEPIDLYGNCKLKPDERSYVLTIKIQK